VRDDLVTGRAQHTGDNVNKAELLCDLRFVKAEYQLAKPAGQPPENSFLVTFQPLAGSSNSFSVTEKNGEQFAAELDVLAALVRARVIRARVDGEETA
jgi:hypothetical protein